MLESLSLVRIVLARPQDAENVGSVCRAMKTMGITDLRIVGGTSFDPARASIVAVHAADLLSSARRYDDLESAVAGCSLVAGATRRWGKKRKSVRLTPIDLAERIASSPTTPVAVVFGNEATGLNDRELASCHVAVTIASSPDARSLNLSHAVQIICYEIYRRLHAESGKRFYTPVPAERLDLAISGISRRLETIGVAAQPYVPLLRDLLARAAISSSELKRFEALFAKLSGLSRKRE